MAQSSKSQLLSSDGFNGYNEQLQGAALKATRNAALLPSDLNFYRTLDRGLAKEVDASSARVLSLANRLIDLIGTADSSSSRSSKGKARLRDDDDVTDNFRSSVVDAMDILFEKADTSLDEVLGVSKPPAIAVNPKLAKVKPTKNFSNTGGRLDPVLQHASHLPKPQLNFSHGVDNSDRVPWRTRLQHKYNAQVPLGYDLQDEGAETEAGSSSHPYRHEIQHISYPQRMFKSAEPVPPRPFEDTPFKWVATQKDLAELLEHLRGVKEIAVDLEYHSFRSYYGFVCLMQISTREGDWVVDTLTLREELVELNEVFTDPEIVKVFHGAESDIVWLQQDFNLYIVNLFDTYHASKVLDFPRHGLATLMEMYCDFTPDKRYQLADWRIRPLTQEMLYYARCDTHYLLFIYDNLRNALLDLSASRAQSRSQSPNTDGTHKSRGSTPTENKPTHAFLREVLSRSEGTALRVCEREGYDAEFGLGPGGWDTLARKWNKGGLLGLSSSNVKGRIYRQIHAWRDRIARAEDESTGYVLPNRLLFMLAEQPPTDMASLLAMLPHVNPVLRRRLKELLDTIREAQVEDKAESTPQPTERIRADEDTSLMDVDQTVTVTATATATREPESSDKLWTHQPQQGSSTTSSVLFGNAPADQKPAKVHPHSYAASRSALFVEVRNSESSDRRRQRFLHTAARIHDTMVIAPVAPILPSNVMQATNAVAPAVAAEEPLEGQVEMPFVPASQRHGQQVDSAAEPVKDSIVVVGHAQRKNHKRFRPEGPTTKASETEEFDYSTAPNILDEDSEPEQPEVIESSRKRKQKTHARYDYGDFRAPPKALAQVKSGNQSHTFK